MEKCECYHVNPVKYYLDGESEPRIYSEGHCYGIKECGICSCGGDKAKCDFYESFRKEGRKTMNFAEMWLEAQNNDNWYINKENQIVYNNTYGLVEAEDLSPVEVDNFDFGIESVMKTQWKIWEHPVMTKAQAEEKYGIKIVG